MASRRGRPRRVPARAGRGAARLARGGVHVPPREADRARAPGLMERFTRLLPDRADGLTAGDVAAAVPGAAPDDRPFLLVNMIATADGRATIAGRTGPTAKPPANPVVHAPRTQAVAVPC